MTEPFFDRLERRVRDAGSLLCVGLDPHPDDLAESTPAAAAAFCHRIVAATAPFAAAFKPNAAFFEALGPEGVAALRDVIAAVPDGVPVILDAKRGDIASTARAYATAAFDVLGADAVTVNPWMGRDSVAPFVERAERGVFLLCRTSNPGAAEVQDVRVVAAGGGVGGPLYEHVARRAAHWSDHRNLGLVVGATEPSALARVRAVAPDAWLLVPGVGAQGGDLAAALRAGLRADGRGLLVNVSRGISRASDRAATAEDLRDAIERERAAIAAEAASVRTTAPADDVADGLLEVGCVQFGSFTLKSGLRSPVYVDLRRLVSHPRLLERVAEAYVTLMQGLRFDRVAALPYAALPIGTAVALRGGWPLVYPRREAKDYGTKVAIEGEYAAGERVVVLDDLATTAGTKLEALEKLGAAGLGAEDVVVLVDRESGAREALAAVGCRLHAVYTLTGLVARWQAAGRVSPAQADEVRAFVRASAPAGS